MRVHYSVTASVLAVLFAGCGSRAPSEGQNVEDFQLTRSNAQRKLAAANEAAAKQSCKSLSLTASPPSPQPLGTSIWLTADADCTETAEYRFLYKPVGGESCGADGCGPWLELRGWGEATYLLNPTGLNKGRYKLRAEVTLDRSQGKDAASGTLEFEFTDPCREGYASGVDGTCVDVDECTSGNGGCDPLTTCTNTLGGRTCGACPSGYTGAGESGCVDIDECAAGNGGCDVLTVCTNTQGARTCGACPSGYTGSGETGCTDIDECASGNGGCDSITLCLNAAGTYACGPCPAGYTGDGYDGCTDIDECKAANGACDPLTACTNTPGSRECGACPEGYTGTGDTACLLPFVATEMVGRPTNHSIAIKAIAGQAVEAYVEFGSVSGVYSGKTLPVVYPDGFIQAEIDGLASNALYSYRMRYRPSGSAAEFRVGNEYTFQTQRSRSSNFTFAVQSDSHQGYAAFYNDDLYRTTIGNIAAERPDFLVDLGDTISLDDTTETQATVRQKYLNQRSVFDIAAHSTPVFLALGNHENEEGWNLDDMGADNVQNSVPVLGANARKRYFMNPVPNGFYSGNTEPLPQIDGDHLRGDYYAFEWGNALFVVIDPFWYTMSKPYAGTTGGEKNDEVVGNRWDWTLGNQQYDWLKSTLESSTARFKFVFAHQMTGGNDDYIRAGALGAKYCEWGGYDLDGVTWAFDEHRSWAMPIHQLFVQNNVTAFFHGHDHVFAKEVLDGVVYQELPHAANPDYAGGFGNNTTNYAGGILLNNSGHLRVSVTPNDATVEYIRSYTSGAGNNGEVAYSYVIQPCDTQDSDGDGVNDCDDDCPSDPKKNAPGLCGCGAAETDSDGDGTADCRDGCDDDPLKTEPGSCGCGIAESQGCCVNGQCLPDSIMVVRVGEGTAPLNANDSTATFIEEHRLSDGTLIQPVHSLPTVAVNGQQPLTLSAQAPAEGSLKRSLDGRFVTLAGYAAAAGVAAVAQTASATTNRVIARMDAFGTIDTSTLLATAFNGSKNNNANPRGVVTDTGLDYWVVGAGTSSTGGLWYGTFGTNAATQIFGQSDNGPSNARTCDIFAGQLYIAANASPFIGVSAVGLGLPTARAAVALLPGFVASGTGTPSPYDFAVLDRDPAVTGVDTIYLSDDRATASGGGIQKWLFDGSTWKLAYTLNAGLSTGVRHLLAVELPNRVHLLAVTTATPNGVIKIIDDGSGSPAVTLFTAATNTALRGVALAPVAQVPATSP